MCKLIEGPRIPTELKAPTKKRRVKVKTVPDDVQVKFTVLKEGSSSQVNQLFELYKQDRYKARVKYMNSPQGYSYRRLVIFEFGEKDFEITEFENTFGISITNRIYSSQRKINSIIFKKGKFYRINNTNRKRGVMPMTYYGLLSFIRESESGYGYEEESAMLAKSKAYEYLVNRFPWVKTLAETEAAKALAFNTVVSKGLTGQKELLRHVYKIPINIINIIQKEVPSMYNHNNRNYIRATNRPRNIYDKLRQWKEVSKVLDGVQNLTEEMYYHHHFYDTCNMAHKLGRRVNCRWGIKKLEQVHDEWAKDLRNILLDCEIEYMLKVRKPYYGLAKHTGWKLLFTNKEMLVEGVRQNHCVGGYIDRVERGECAIFHIEGFTLQVGMERTARVEHEKGATIIRALTTDTLPVEQIDRMLLNGVETTNVENKPKFYYKLTNLQFRGLRNCDPSKELVERVNQLLEEYSLTDECQEICEGSFSATEFQAMCDEIHKSKWTVIINHETGKYEIEDKGLDGLEAKEAGDVNIKKVMPIFNADIGYDNLNA